MNHASVESVLKALGAHFLSFGEKGFLYGPQGLLLRRNLENLWFEHCITMPPYNTFYSQHDKLSENLKSARLAAADSVPFGLATVEDSKALWNQHCFPETSKALNHRIARVFILSEEESAKTLYHKKQRERKVWWRKFARNPSRYALSEAKRANKSRESVEIAAKFDFGDVLVETISYRQDAKKLSSCTNPVEELSGLHIVEHTASLDWGCLATICDSLEFVNNSHELRLHPKLSPYKAGFHSECEVDEDLDSQAKLRLISYLNAQLRAKGLHTVVTKTKKGLDTLHVPLTITVNTSSLQNGIIKVTSQLTKIPESVHVTDLPKHILMRS